MSAITAIMSSKGLVLVVILISTMCGTVISDDQPPGISHSINASQSQSSSNQSGADLALSTRNKTSDTSRSQVSVPPIKENGKLGNASNTDCATKPCVTNNKVSSSNASAPLPNEAEGIVHISNESHDLSNRLNPEAFMRGFYVFVGLSVIVMAYIAWKSFGKRPAQVHRYGVVGNRDDLEMAPLDSDDGDDDDTTHFDISSHRLQT